MAKQSRLKLTSQVLSLGNVTVSEKRRRPFGHRRKFNEQSDAAQPVSRSVFLRGSFFDLQLCKFFENLVGVFSGLHFLLDVQDLAILAHDESDSV